ncbi:unnamed protein product, partial [Phaeothamnion confervicola]
MRREHCLFTRFDELQLNAGIGTRAAGRLVQRGYHVVMTTRNKTKGERVFGEISDEFPEGVKQGGRLELMLCDLNDLESVAQFVLDFRSKFQRLDVLINDAGTTLPGRSKDNYQQLFQAGFLGAFVLTRGLLDLIEQTDGARVINLSSVMHRFGSTDWEAAALGWGRGALDVCSLNVFPNGYADAKLAMLMFTEELRRRFRSAGVSATAIAVHPGTVKTAIWGNVGGFGAAYLVVIKDILFLEPDDGAFPVLYAATAPMDDLIKLNKEHDPLAPDHPPLYLEPYWLPFGLTIPFELLGPWIGVAASDASLPRDYVTRERRLWDAAHMLAELARLRRHKKADLQLRSSSSSSSPLSGEDGEKAER